MIYKVLSERRMWKYGIQGLAEDKLSKLDDEYPSWAIMNSPDKRGPDWPYGLSDA
ncbi:MAG: hypothetical protein QXV17_05645 [Candidatus Micrarchaeaceae archaeon]